MYNNAKDILLYDNNYEDLSCRSDEINIKEEMKYAREVISSIKHTMEKNNLKILTAPEIGIKKRIMCIWFLEEIKTFINPIITNSEGIQIARETSATLPGKIFIRPRNTKVDIMYQRPTAQVESRQLVGAAAILFQQGIDSLDGISIVDIGLEIDDDFDSASEDERAEIIDTYLDSLDMKHKLINKLIEEDAEAKQLSDGIKFMNSVVKGETILQYE